MRLLIYNFERRPALQNKKEIELNIFKYFIKRSRHNKNYRTAKKISKKINSQDFLYDSMILSYLRKIDPFVFEELLLYTFRQRRMKTYRNKRYTGDGGIDGKVRIDGYIYYIQAKRYQDYINLQHVIEFNELCKRFNKQGFFIHTGKTGEAAGRIGKSEQSNIQIVSGQKLIDFLKYKE